MPPTSSIMATASKISLCLIASSIATLISIMEYWRGLNGNELLLARSVSAVTTAGKNGPKYIEPTLAAGNDGITEVQVILMALGLSALLALSSLIVVTIYRVRHGHHKLYLPLAFCSTVLCLGIIYVGFKSGIQYSL
ncbi:hypothetical protein ACJJI5_13635 [Microbulbifer sp. EKSA008]|uniref:hypothetical protein n=1 Tax=unclassified Microbulbifer TaxID=2619833 RepID=UPI002B2A7336|nr:hypothetical protein QT397_16000 [Microbulbifer sp. MKSA007]